MQGEERGIYYIEIYYIEIYILKNLVIHLHQDISIPQAQIAV